MPNPLPRALRRSVGDLSFSIFLATVVLCLFRSSDLPSLDVGVGGEELAIGPADLGLIATAALALPRLRSRGWPSRWLLAATATFALLVVVSAVPNGAYALSAAGKLALFAGLTLGAAAFVTTPARLAALASVLVGFCVLAVSWGAVEFVVRGGGRQASFLGEHDLAALAAMTLVVGLAHIYARGGRPSALAVVGIGTGALGIVLGSALASLLGLYLAAAAMLALGRRRVQRNGVVVTVVVCAAVTAATLGIRSGDLGFLRSWFGPPPETPGQYAASWSQRLIYVYVGGRIFLDRPILGTGWHGELPPSEYLDYLPDARARFSDQPPHYFPPSNGTFIPQQTFDQVLFQLGLVGAASFLLVATLAVRRAVSAGRRRLTWRRWQEQAYVPLGWLASLAGALAGAALFGGAPLTALFWLTLGVVAGEQERGAS